MKIMLSLVIVCGICISAIQAKTPSFESDFAKHLTDGEANAQGSVERVYKLDIDPDLPLFANVRKLFYPSISGQGGQIRDHIMTLGVGVFFIFLVWIGIQFLTNGDNEGEMEKNRKHILWLLYGAFLYFGAVWILGVALNITQPGGSTALVQNFQDNLWFQLLAFFKGLAFFAAIVSLVVAGYRMMQAMDAEDQLTAARNGIINVLIALALLKVIDFIYLLAQNPEFFSEAKGLIIKISRILGYVVGVGMLLSIFVSGYLYITDGGTGEGAKKAKNIFQTVFFVGLTIFLFLLVVYQVIAQFA